MSENRPLDGRIAVVTGASRGIGRAIAQRFAAEGARVVATARTVLAGSGPYAGSLAETVDLIEKEGGRAIAVPIDLSDGGVDRAAVLRAGEIAFDGAVDVVVNNAAATRRFDLRFSSMTADVFRESLEVNVWAGWDLARLAIPGMVEKGAGWILNIGSRSAAPKAGPPYSMHPMVAGQCLYGGTKAMLDRVTTGAAMELYESNIAVNALAPEGAVATENARTTAGVDPATSEPVETMAEAALALCSGEPRRLTGQVRYSLSFLVESSRPVWNLDGRTLMDGWQPSDIDPARLFAGYLK
jgi:NAD(P)-dependent dehydrogenase (short-subunit alcohol dehydrogenase family)